MSDAAALAEALAAFQAEMPTVTKGKTANVPTKDGKSYSYTYADLADVTEAAMPVLTKHGLSFVACPQHTEHGYELVGMLLHRDGGSLTGALPIMGQQAQQIGSSLTYLRRYLLGCMTGLVTDDDDDGRRSAGAGRAGDRRTEDAAALWSRARHAADLAAVRALWNDADTRGLLGVDVTDDQGVAPLAERLRKLGDAMSTFDQPPAQQQPAEPQPPATPRTATRAQHRMLNAVLGKLGVDMTDAGRAERLATLSTLIGRDIDTSAKITAHEMKALLDGLQSMQSGEQLQQVLADARRGGEPS